MIQLLRAVQACSLCAEILLQMPVNALVIRHDVPDSEYRVSATTFPALAFLPGEGHGVLIAEDWVVTAAHAVSWRPIHELTINGTLCGVEKVIIHPGYKKPPKELQSGDAGPLMAFLAASDDIALIKLQHAISGVTPIPVYKGSDENRKVVEIFGAGSTGNGLVGEYPGSPHRGDLRHGETRVTAADGRWLELRFEQHGLPHEAMPADGDSGAAVLINVHGTKQLAGLVSHKFASGQLANFRCCFYGQITYQVRISRYTHWIDTVMSGNRYRIP